MRKEDFDSYLVGLRDTAVEQFKRHKALESMAFVCCSRHPQTGEKGTGVLVVPLTYQNDAEKDSVIGLIRDAVVRFQCFAVVTLVEAWAAPADRAVTGRISERADRREMVMLRAEHRDFGVKAFMAYIVRNGEEATLTDWKEFDWEVPPVGVEQGRFSFYGDIRTAKTINEVKHAEC